MSEARARLERVFRAALAAVDPEPLTRAAAVERIDRPVRVLAAGKAAGGMATGLLGVGSVRVVEGLAVTRDGHAPAPPPLRTRFAAHPLPDHRSAAAGCEARAVAARCRADEDFVVLLSGGASALLSEPEPPLGVEDLRETTRVLLAAGADIGTLNAVRKHLTRVSGGRLARAARRAHRVLVLVVSDVLGDDLATIGSGPCVGDPTSFAEAICGAKAHGAWEALPPAVRVHLIRGSEGAIAESLEAGDPALARVETRLLASNGLALRAAAVAARAEGSSAMILTDRLSGEARAAGSRLAALAAASRPSGRLLLLAGGETTVTVLGPGRGGRAQELALAAALHWHRARPDSRVALLSAGTDGSDGPTDAAGAFADSATVARGQRAGVDAQTALAANDAYRFFAAEGGLLRTGPTGTNVMDLALIEIAGSP